MLQIEKQKQELTRELEDLSDRLDEQGGATAAQIELNKKREQELLKLRHDIEEITISNEQNIGTMRKKHQEMLADLQGNVDNLQKIKSKLEKERNQYKMEAEDLQSNFEVLQKNKVSPLQQMNQNFNKFSGIPSASFYWNPYKTSKYPKFSYYH